MAIARVSSIKSYKHSFKMPLLVVVVTIHIPQLGLSLAMGLVVLPLSFDPTPIQWTMLPHFMHSLQTSIKTPHNEALHIHSCMIMWYSQHFCCALRKRCSLSWVNVHMCMKTYIFKSTFISKNYKLLVNDNIEFVCEGNGKIEFLHTTCSSSRPFEGCIILIECSTSSTYPYDFSTSKMEKQTLLARFQRILMIFLGTIDCLCYTYVFLKQL